MQFTFECELVDLSDNDRQALDDLMLRFASAKRIAFNRLLEGRKVDEVTHYLESLGSLSLNWRYCERAARDAQGEIASQKALLPLYLSDICEKIEEVQKKAWRLESSTEPASAEKLLRRRTKLSLVKDRLRRLEKREEILSKHLAHGTIPKVIFGSRRLFVGRASGKVTREQWRNARNNHLYSIGQSNQKGNANVRIHPDGDKVGINFPRGIVPKARRKGVVRVESERRWFRLRVPEKFRRYVSYLLGSGQAYSVRMIKRDARYFVHMSFEIHGREMKHPPKSTMAIDANPEGFAVAIVKSDGNLLAHRLFKDDRLVYASARKRDAIIGEFVSKIVRYGESHDASTIAIEDLKKMRNGKNFGRRGNRVMHAFIRKKFFDNLLIRCWKENIPVLSVNPAYTSRVGDVKYRERYGLSIHEAAALCIGRRFYGFDEQLEEPLTITVKSGWSKVRVPVRRVWASIYGYHCPSDPYREPPGRKGSRRETTDGDNGAAFTGHPPAEMPPRRRDSMRGSERVGSAVEVRRLLAMGVSQRHPRWMAGKLPASSLLGTQ